MKFGIFNTALNTDPGNLAAVAQHAEDCGFESFDVSEHIALYPGAMRLLTVGLGVLPGEAHALGVEFAARGRRADEAIDVLRLLWAGGTEGVSFTGEHFSFQNLCSFPKPWRTSTLPVHVGGASRAAARRPGCAVTATSPAAG